MPDKVKQYRGQLEGRSMLVKSLRVLPIESIVRGYITGTLIIEIGRESQSIICVGPNLRRLNSLLFSLTIGSAWSEYKKKGTVCDIALPTGMQESEAFPEPLWTPSTKAEIGDHDENIHPSKAAVIIGEKHAAEMEKISIELYTKARDYAKEHGIIIADTKFEFGVDENDTLYLIDEVLTPGNDILISEKVYNVGCSRPNNYSLLI